MSTAAFRAVTGVWSFTSAPSTSVAPLYNMSLPLPPLMLLPDMCDWGSPAIPSLLADFLMDDAGELANCLLCGVCVRRRADVCSWGHYRYLAETCRQASSHTIDHDMCWSGRGCGALLLRDIGATTDDSAVSTATGRTDTSHFT